MNIAVPIVAQFFCFSFYVAIKSMGYVLDVPTIGLEFGLIKDIVDPVYILVFPWNGWVFLVPVLFAKLCRWRLAWVLFLYLICSAVMGVANTFISFPVWDLHRVVKGILTYIVLYFPILAIFSLTYKVDR